MKPLRTLPALPLAPLAALVRSTLACMRLHRRSELFAAKQAAVINAPFANAALPDVDGRADVSQQPVPADWWNLYDDPVLEQLVERSAEIEHGSARRRRESGAFSVKRSASPRRKAASPAVRRPRSHGRRSPGSNT
jgi:outer membrane protein TolC